VIGKPPAVSSQDDEKARILATASALIPIIEAAIERSGKRKTAGPGPSKREAVHAGDEPDSEEDEVESEPDEVEQEDSEVEPDDNEGEDDDNVELAPEPRKTYARLARRSRGVSAKADRKRHERRCLICRHPEREEIEDEFIQWQHPYDIGKATRSTSAWSIAMPAP
jgi:type IV secretory pathway VirB10-like protein